MRTLTELGPTGFPALHCGDLLATLELCKPNRTVAVVKDVPTDDIPRATLFVLFDAFDELATLLEVHANDVQQVTYFPNADPWDQGDSFELLQISLSAEAGSGGTFEIID